MQVMQPIQRRTPGVPRQAAAPGKAVLAAWVLLLGCLFAAHVCHLRADFPNYSPWMDYSKYTDEGWYANAAIRHHLFGRWLLPGDFNPGVALPVWPSLLTLVFHFTGVSLVAARATDVLIFGATVVMTSALVASFASRGAAMTAATLMLASPYLYAFSRLALLEPLMALLLLCSWMVALRLRRDGEGWRHWALAALTGSVLSLLVLTKTTGIALVPSVVWMVFAQSGGARNGKRSTAAVTGVLLVCLACLWVHFAWVNLHGHAADFFYLFAANQWERPATSGAKAMAFAWAAHGVLWIGSGLAGLSLGAVAVAMARVRALWSNPVVVPCLLAIAGPVAMIGWQNHPQPRYYAVIAAPLVLLLCVSLDALYRQAGTGRKLAFAGYGVAAVLAISGLIRIVEWAAHPEYAFVHAAEGVTAYISQHSQGRDRLLLSISGDEIALITGAPTICTDYGVWPLDERIHQYRPGWFAEWNDIDSGTLDAISEEYRLQRVTSFKAFDDEDRNELILYRMIRKQNAP